MNKSNAANVRIKRDYFDHLKGPRRQSEASIDAVAKTLSRFEGYTRHKDFKTFRKEQAIGFTAYLSRELNEGLENCLARRPSSPPSMPSRRSLRPVRGAEILVRAAWTYDAGAKVDYSESLNSAAKAN